MRSLEPLPPEELPDSFRLALVPLLEDKIRLNRIEAARVLSVAADSLDAKERKALRWTERRLDPANREWHDLRRQIIMLATAK